jgi:RHS repeat-associated protein
VLWLLADHLGSIKDVVEYNSGTDTTMVVNHIQYSAFGIINNQSDSDYEPRYTYTGREWDADAELFYYRARWYDPVSGRFISEDPISFAAADTNLARYVGNAAANLVDPSGLAETPHIDQLRQLFADTSGGTSASKPLMLNTWTRQQLIAQQRLAIEAVAFNLKRAKTHTSAAQGAAALLQASKQMSRAQKLQTQIARLEARAAGIKTAGRAVPILLAGSIVATSIKKGSVQAELGYNNSAKQLMKLTHTKAVNFATTYLSAAIAENRINVQNIAAADVRIFVNSLQSQYFLETHGVKAANMTLAITQFENDVQPLNP